MKLPKPRKPSEIAFTLVEVLTAMAIFGLALAGLLSAHLMGLKMHNITATKLGATLNARAALNSVRNDIRGGKLLYVGNGDATHFENVTNGAPQEGNAVQIYPTVNTNVFVRYFLDATNKMLKRITSAGGHPELIANYITNTTLFRAEDFHGGVLTNEENHRVVRMVLEFYQWEFPVAKVGSHYDYYRLQTRITRRAIE